MMSLGPSAPSPTAEGTPAQVATGQQGYNVAAQSASNSNTVNPYGSTTWAISGYGPGGTPIYTATQSLTPAQQGLLNTLQSTQQTAGTQAGNLLSGADYGAVPAATAIGNETTGLTGQAVGQELSYLDPYFSTQTSQLDTQLRNQGFDPTSPAYQQAMLNLSNQQGNAVTGFLAQIEPQMYQQALSTYNEPANLATTLASFGAPNTAAAGSTVSTAALQPANYQGAVTQEQTVAEQNYQSQLAQQQAMISGIFGLGAAGITGGASLLAPKPTTTLNIGGGTSDSAAKYAIEPLGELAHGLGLYRFSYFNEPGRWLGVLADELQQVLPECVASINGVLHLVGVDLRRRIA